MRPRIINDTLVYGGADFVSKILLFISYPILATVISPQQFGAIEIISTGVGLLGLLTNSGLNNAVQRFYWDGRVSPIRQRATITTGLSGQIIFGVTLSIVLFVIYSILESNNFIPDNFYVDKIGIISIILMISVLQWIQYTMDVTRLHFSPWRFFAISISRSGAVFVGVISLIYLSPSLENFYFSQICVLVAVFPISIFLIRKDISLKYFSFDRLVVLTKYGYPFIFAGLAYWVFGSMDRWMLMHFRSIEEVGVYSVAARFAMIAMFVSVAFGQAWSPMAFKIRSDFPDTYNFIYGQVFLLLVFVMSMCSGFIALFSGEILWVFMPDYYNDSSTVLIILSMSTVIYATQQITAIGISIAKKTKLFVTLTWVAASVNFLGNWALVPKYGVDGAAISTMLAYLTLSFSFYYFTQKLNPVIISRLNFSILFFVYLIIFVFSLKFHNYGFDQGIMYFKFFILVTLAFISLKVVPLSLLRRQF